MHQYAPSNTKSQRGLNSNDYNIPAEVGIIIQCYSNYFIFINITFWVQNFMLGVMVGASYKLLLRFKTVFHLPKLNNNFNFSIMNFLYIL